MTNKTPDTQSGQSSASYQVSSGHRTYIYVLLCLLFFFDDFDRYMISSVLPLIRQEFALTDMQSGMLVSAIYWSILILVFPTSIIIDRWSRRKTISIMAGIWSLAAMACAFVGNFAQLFVARTFLGAGEAGYGAGGTAMITALYPPEKRARMLGLWNSFDLIGTAVALAIGGLIAAHWGWRGALGLTAAPGLIVAILFFFIKDYKTVELVKTVKSGADKIKMKAADVAKEFLRTPSLILTYLGMGFVRFVSVGLLTWLPTYFNRENAVPLPQAGMMTSTIVIGAIIGAPLGGYLSDVFVKKIGLKSRLVFVTITTLISAVCCFSAFFIFHGNIQIVALVLTAITIGCFIGAGYTVTQEVIHPGLRAISGGLSVVVMVLIGGSLAPIVIGAISDAAGIRAAMLIMPAFLIGAAMFFFIGSFFFMKDYNKVEKIQLQAES